MTGTLTAEGARYLRAARDTIMSHPETFSMGDWECGSTACIAGHIARHAIAKGVPGFAGGCWSASDVSALLGFGKAPVWPARHPLAALFYVDLDGPQELAATEAATRINEFLWQHGYPATETEEVACIG